MEHQPAMYALLDLHATLGGKIIDNRQEARRLANDMKHVEAVLKMLQPGYNVRSIAVRRRKPNPWFKKGECFRAALDVLRTAEGPLTTKDIARLMLRSKGVAEPTTKNVRDMIGAVHRSLQNHKGKSVATVGEGMGGPGFPVSKGTTEAAGRDL